MFKFKNVVYNFPVAIGEDCISEMRLSTATDDDGNDHHHLTMVDHWGRERDRRTYDNFHTARRASKAIFRLLVGQTNKW